MKTATMLEDWRQMISNEKEFGDDHFLYVFQSDVFSNEDIDEIFSSFSEGDELKKIYWTYQNTFNLADLTKVSSSNEKLVELIKLDLYESARILKKMQEPILDALLGDLKFKFIDKATFYKLSKELSLGLEVTEHLTDYMSERTTFRGEKYGRLIFEAYTGLGQYSKRLLWYLARPLYDTDYNPDLYFEIKQNAGNYLIIEDEILVYNMSAVT